MRTSKPAREIRNDGGQRVPAPMEEGNVTRPKGRRVSRATAGLGVAAAAALAAAPAVPGVVGGRYLNHNETLLQARARRHRHGGAIAGGVAVAAGTAVLAAAPVVPAVLGGLNLGNHNETLLASP